MFRLQQANHQNIEEQEAYKRKRVVKEIRLKNPQQIPAARRFLIQKSSDIAPGLFSYSMIFSNLNSNKIDQRVIFFQA
jgi:hypothetical protein